MAIFAAQEADRTGVDNLPASETVLAMCPYLARYRDLVVTFGAARPQTSEARWSSSGKNNLHALK
jgi:hypothetical protein